MNVRDFVGPALARPRLRARTTRRRWWGILEARRPSPPGQEPRRVPPPDSVPACPAVPIHPRPRLRIPHHTREEPGLLLPGAGPGGLTRAGVCGRDPRDRHAA